MPFRKISASSSRRRVESPTSRDSTMTAHFLRSGSRRSETGSVASCSSCRPTCARTRSACSAFLEGWPRELPAAFEFRHDSWFDEEVMELLRHRGAAICVSDDGKMALPAAFATTDWVYFRLRREAYDETALTHWHARAIETGARHGFAFFKHEDAGAGPKLAKAFLDLAGQATA